MTIAEMLQAGRDRLVQDGWTKRTLLDPHGHRCALGALMGTQFQKEYYLDGHVQGIFDRDVFRMTPEECRATWYLAQAALRCNPYAVEEENSILQVTCMNDNTNLNTVLQVYDDAILAAKESGE